jgi:hypothetical protein
MVIRDVRLFFFFFGETGVWTQGFALAKQALIKQSLYHLSSPPFPDVQLLTELSM